MPKAQKGFRLITNNPIEGSLGRAFLEKKTNKIQLDWERLCFELYDRHKIEQIKKFYR